ncbi:arylesterase [Marinobacter sp. C2H3]|uniref:arylesterase n=1 Tax=Marinobacter sp. C2H3 TaxID=3119003 RepID=UPI003FA53F7C
MFKHTLTGFVRSVILLAALFVALPAAAADRTLLILGDSLSAGYGVPTETAWVQLLRQRLVDRGLEHWDVVNASISGETTDGGARRLPDLLEKHRPDIVMVELGGNDGLRGFPPDVIRANLTTMITESQKAGARVVLVGMQIPPNYGQRYTEAFAGLYPSLSDRYGTALVPFFLADIYNHDELMQNDGIHPTEAGQPRLLENVWPVLAPLLEASETARR